MGWGEQEEEGKRGRRDEEEEEGTYSSGYLPGEQQNDEVALTQPQPLHYHTWGLHSIFTPFPTSPRYLPASKAHPQRGLDTMFHRAREEGQEGWLLLFHSHNKPGEKENQRQPVTRMWPSQGQGGRRGFNA